MKRLLLMLAACCAAVICSPIDVQAGGYGYGHSGGGCYSKSYYGHGYASSYDHCGGWYYTHSQGCYYKRVRKCGSYGSSRYEDDGWYYTRRSDGYRWVYSRSQRIFAAYSEPEPYCPTQNYCEQPSIIGVPIFIPGTQSNALQGATVYGSYSQNNQAGLQALLHEYNSEDYLLAQKQSNDHVDKAREVYAQALTAQQEHERKRTEGRIAVQKIATVGEVISRTIEAQAAADLVQRSDATTSQRLALVAGSPQLAHAQFASVLEAKCFKCHTPQAPGGVKGGLDLTKIDSFDNEQRFAMYDQVLQGKMPKNGEALTAGETLLFAKHYFDHLGQ